MVLPAVGPVRSVRVVVVSFNNVTFIGRCLDALARTEWTGSTEIVVVDNASTDGTAEYVATHHPEVTLIRSAVNTGFGGGVNLALADLGTADAVALVNSDAFVSPDWLGPLVQALDAHPNCGAANAVLIFDGRYRRRRLRAGRPSRLVVGGSVVVEGPQGRRLSGPVVRLGRQDRALWVAEGVDVGPADTWLEPTEPDAFDVVNNAGVELTRWLYGRDRNLGQRADQLSDEVAPIEFWSGGLVLVRRAYLDDVGHFDQSLFLYYEDLDLAWRGRRRGWTYLVVPRARARHGHGLSASADSARAEFWKQRNHLVVVTRHGTWGQRAWVWGAFVALALRRLALGIARAIGRGERPDWSSWRADRAAGFAAWEMLRRRDGTDRPGSRSLLP
jgi:GT2 family glycosyltransferase